MDNLSTPRAPLIDRQYDAALQFGELLTQLYLLGPQATTHCLQTVSTSPDVEAAVRSWLEGYEAQDSGSVSSELPPHSYYADGAHFNYAYCAAMDARTEGVTYD